MSVLDLMNYTYDDYKNWEGDWELIEGVPVSMAPAPMRIHQNIAADIVYLLKDALDEDSCPGCLISFANDWKISEESVVRPDIVLTCGDEGKAYLTKAPKIIFEIISPSTARKDETVKFDLYEAEGVQYYILVYPDDLKAKAYTLKEGKYRKIADFTHEKLKFEDIACDLELDFERLFRRYRA